MDTIYFLLAVAVVSTVIFMLMMRVDRIDRRRGSSAAARPIARSTTVRSEAGSARMAAAETTGDSQETTVFFQDAREYPGSLWNHLKTRLFPLHRRAASNIRLGRITEGLLP